MFLRTLHYEQNDYKVAESVPRPHKVVALCRLSRWAHGYNLQQTRLYSEILLTDRFLCSHRLEWLCLFLGCGLGQWLALSARCLTAGGETWSVQDSRVTSRGGCSLRCFTGTPRHDGVNDQPFNPIKISFSFVMSCKSQDVLHTHTSVSTLFFLRI